MRVLVVEDEASIRGFININLKRNNYDILEATSAEEALELVETTIPDIALLDVMLPGRDGYILCKTLREKLPQLGIIMLTAKGQDMDKIMGLEYGADDYMVKPFNPLELILRIKALARRLNTEDIIRKDNRIIELDPFILDLYSKKVKKNNIEIEVTPKEYLIMKIFLENPNKAFSRDELLDYVWGENYFGDSKIIDVNIRRLRAKIEDKPSEPKYIETVWGMGYRWKG